MSEPRAEQKKPKVVREATVVRRIITYVHRLGGVIRKSHGTMFGVSADPDFYGVLKGRGFGVEAKTRALTSKATAAQKERLKEWARAGAITGIVRDLDEFRALMLRAGVVTPEEDQRAMTWGQRKPKAETAQQGDS